MPKIKYQFNPHSLTIERVKVTLKDKLKRLMWVVSSGTVFAAVLLVVAYNFLDSPKEKMLKRELDQYQFQYNVMNNRIGRMQKVLTDLQQRDNNVYRAIFEAEPISSDERAGGYGGAERYSNMEGLNSSEIIKNTAVKLDEINSEMVVQSKSFDQVFQMVKNKEKMLASIPAIQPLTHRTMTGIGSHFGYRIDPFYKVMKLHSGIDFTAATGTKVYATGDGVVNQAGWEGGYGNLIVINHGYSYSTAYGHLSRIGVRDGQPVKRGQVIGYVGSTGKSTASHLHYEVRKNGKAINPINYFYNDITPAEYDLLIRMSQLPSQTMD
ncbi:MAG: M23 family metallopeptidase [Bacteroidota bacterium]|nr:M23 family metallopeptidase [Bacteroidota bacterium]